MQVFIRNVHIRYEDTLMHPDPDITFTCGICLFNLSVEFTNRWVVGWGDFHRCGSASV